MDGVAQGSGAAVPSSAPSKPLVRPAPTARARPAPSTAQPFPPRILIIMREHWPRALLRASLRERGHDAVGAPDLHEAAVYPPVDPDRGPVGLIVLDAGLLTEASAGRLRDLLDRHGRPRVLLVADPEGEPPAGQWADVVRQPVQVGTLVRAVERHVEREPAPGA